jgi:hypothetical protein
MGPQNYDLIGDFSSFIKEENLFSLFLDLFLSDPGQIHPFPHSLLFSILRLPRSP